MRIKGEGDPMAQLGFVILYTRDVAKKMAFYERAFGLQKKHLAEREVYGEMHGDVPLQFVQEDFARAYVADFVANRLERPPAAIEIGFLLDDVPAAYQRAIDIRAASRASRASGRSKRGSPLTTTQPEAWIKIHKKSSPAGRARK